MADGPITLVMICILLFLAVVILLVGFCGLRRSIDLIALAAEFNRFSIARRSCHLEDWLCPICQHSNSTTACVFCDSLPQADPILLTQRQETARHRLFWQKEICPSTRRIQWSSNETTTQGFVSTRDGKWCRVADHFEFASHDLHNSPFYLKRKWFTQQMNTLRGHHRGIPLVIDRKHLLTDSKDQLIKIEPHGSLYVTFRNEKAIDGGGVSREWFSILDSMLFTELFVPSASGFWINSNSDAISFEFVGRFLGHALLDTHFIRSRLSIPLLKHILGIPISAEDLKYFDFQLHQSFLSLSTDQELYFMIGDTELINNGQDTAVTDDNMAEFKQLMLKHYLFDKIHPQLEALKKGLYHVIPYESLSIFDYKELDLLLSGLIHIDLNDWKANTIVILCPQAEKSKVMEWFWTCIASFSHEQRAQMLQLVTGSSCVPPSGFKVSFFVQFRSNFNSLGACWRFIYDSYHS